MKLNFGTLHTYLNASLENRNDHVSEPPQLMHLVNHMDQLIQEELFVDGIDIDGVPALLSMNAYMLLASAVQQTLTGHAVAVFPLARTALESACYAFLVAGDKKMSDIWLNRDNSKTARGKCRDNFTVSNAVRKLKSLSPDMADYVNACYEVVIDYGAHPNIKSITSHFKIEDMVDETYIAFTLDAIYGKNSWQVNSLLLLCTEVSQAIVFLIAASANNHPLIHERLTTFQDWMDEKNRVVENILGYPLDYTGPMYSSIRPPR